LPVGGFVPQFHLSIPVGELTLSLTPACNGRSG
jgi:hypothetical protein